MHDAIRRVIPFLLSLQLLVVCALPMVAAQEDDERGLKIEIDGLQRQITEKEGLLHGVEQSIKRYKQKITEQEAAVSSLNNQVTLLENRIKGKQLAVERIQQTTELVQLQVRSLGDKIQLEEMRLHKRQMVLGAVLREIVRNERVRFVDVFVTQPSFSRFVSHVEDTKRLERELLRVTQQLKLSKSQLEAERRQLDVYRMTLQEQSRALVRERQKLEQDQAAKVSLISSTQEKEEEFQRILYELRQEQQEAAESVSSLQDRLKDSLDRVDEALARGDVLLNWPVPTRKGIAAHFHDPTYPFRKLFEHSGVDIPVSVGTPVRAAAGGYIAWTRTGKQYGNYIMVVHPGGVATVYAHLSRFIVQPDTYVERGDVIALSGGRPGDQGAGLSTGPHLHFEVRQQGIPVNPEQFLPSVDE